MRGPQLASKFLGTYACDHSVMQISVVISHHHHRHPLDHNIIICGRQGLEWQAAQQAEALSLQSEQAAAKASRQDEAAARAAEDEADRQRQMQAWAVEDATRQASVLLCVAGGVTWHEAVRGLCYLDQHALSRAAGKRALYFVKVHSARLAQRSQSL